MLNDLQIYSVIIPILLLISILFLRIKCKNQRRVKMV